MTALTSPEPKRAPLHVTAIGGGTGLPITLRALRAWLFGDGRAPIEPERLSAIVTVCDDGGSSGRLRERYPVIPFGDIRNCLLALSAGEAKRRALFGYRFGGAGDVGGHNLGNLILAALALESGCADTAVQWASDFLGVCGRVFPCSVEQFGLIAHYIDGTAVVGESRIAGAQRRIRRVALWPCTPRGNPAAIHAIERADVVVLGPGSLFTSLLPVLLIEEVRSALLRSRARIVLVTNLATEPGETDSYRASDMVMVLQEHIPGLRIHDVVLHRGSVDAVVTARHPRNGARAVKMDAEMVAHRGCRPVWGDVADRSQVGHHDPVRLGHTLARLCGDLTGEAATARP